MRYAVMQPTFLPWAGFFRLVAHVDRFVFLDDVQLSRQSWQTRNRILVDGRVHWVSVPIEHESLDQKINETNLADAGGRWRKKTARLLLQAYARRQFKGDLIDLIAAFEQGSEVSLAELNMNMILKTMSGMGLKTPVLKSSELDLRRTDRTDRLIEIGERLACKAYVSPIGARDYLESDGFTSRCALRLDYMACEPPEYDQGAAGEFVSHLSVVDVVANLGWSGAAAYISSNWRVPREFGLHVAEGKTDGPDAKKMGGGARRAQISPAIPT